MTPEEESVLARIDDEAIVRDLTGLVGIASVDGTPEEADAQRWCADRLGALGLEVDVWDVDIEALAARADFPGMEVERTRAVGCVGVLGDGDATPALALYGHTDVVPPGDPRLWGDRDPFALAIADGLAWGRGACDMKAGLVAAVAAVEAVIASGTTLDRPLAVHCVSAEEDGGVGAFATLLRGHRADSCVIAEPTARTLIPANAGSLTFALDVPGLATHGATRTRGVSAVEKFEVVYAALRALERDRNADVPPEFAHLDLAWPLSVGRVHAGDWASTVPDRLTASGRYGVRVDETVEQAVSAFEAAVAEACRQDPWLRDHPVTVTWPGGRFAPGTLATGHRLAADAALAVAEVTGVDPPVVGAPYGSDLRHYTGAGIATVQYGPGDVRYAHAVDEHVPLDEVFACARVYALLALRSCRSVA
jgi:acetylornithine deacetylase